MISQQTLNELLLPILLSRGKIYIKFKPVLAEKTESTRKVVTRTSSGIETENTASPGDYIVENITEAGEQYVLRAAKFKQLYKKTQSFKNGKRVYLPKGRVHGVQIDEEICQILGAGKKFEIMAPWGQPQTLRLGDFLVSPPGYLEFYGIAGKEFEETYRLKTHKKKTHDKGATVTKKTAISRSKKNPGP